MGRVTWRTEALADTEKIKEYIAQGSRAYATLVAQRIFEATVRLNEFPESGRIVPEAEDDRVREVIVGNYRVIYRVWPQDEVEVVAVVHAARQLGPEDIPG